MTSPGARTWAECGAPASGGRSRWSGGRDYPQTLVPHPWKSPGPVWEDRFLSFWLLLGGCVSVAESGAWLLRPLRAPARPRLLRRTSLGTAGATLSRAGHLWGGEPGPKSHGPRGSRAGEGSVWFAFAFGRSSEETGTSQGMGFLARKETEATALTVSGLSSSDTRRLLFRVTFFPPPRFLFREPGVVRTEGYRGEGGGVRICSGSARPHTRNPELPRPARPVQVCPPSPAAGSALLALLTPARPGATAGSKS